MRSLFFLLFVLLCFKCTYHDLPYPCNESTLQADPPVIQHASTCSAADGSIELKASGGFPPYTYELNDAVQTDPIFHSLSPGVYKAFIYDDRKCMVALENLLISASDFEFISDVTADTDCLEDNGRIEVNVTSGSPPHLFKLGNGEYATNNVFEGLAPGDYDILSKDVNECVIQLRVSVAKGFTGTSWENEIRPVVVQYCALSGCHVGGASRPDLRVYQTAKSYARQMKTLTQDGRMPFDGTMPADKIALIACWVDEGALEN